MHRRGFLQTALGLAGARAMPGSENSGRKPNIVILLADDLGYGELGCQGNPQIPTPHIDSIAHNGVRFTDGYVTAPVCCPSRAGLMTGRYQTRFGHELNAIGLQNKLPDVGLPLSETTLASTLKTVGYATGIFGKWHLGGTPKFYPQQRGFDEFFGFLHEGHFYMPPESKGLEVHLRNPEPPYDLENPLMRGSQVVEEKQYLTDALTREAVSFIDRHKSNPFFLYVPYNAIHSPMQALAPETDRFANIPDFHRRVFAGMLASLDKGIGRILSTLHASGLDENTLIFFLSDNGGPTSELTSRNQPLRGFKGQTFEGGIRIPFMARWKGKIKPGQVLHDPVISMDMFATAAAVCGAKPEHPLDGVDLLPYMTGASKTAPHETLFWRYSRNAALRRGNWKIARQASETDFQLFDLSTDIAETRNLAAEHPETLRELKAAWDRMNAQMVPPLWGPQRGGKKK